MHHKNSENIEEQDSILVGCIPPAWKLVCASVQLPPPDVTPLRGVGLQINQFEQVSSEHH